MIDINVRSNVKQFMKGLDDHQKKQLPYAAMKALNATAADMRKGVIEKIKSKQKSKKAWWNNPVTGINRIFAKKTSLIAAIYTKMPWAHLQEEGGIKKAKHGRIAIPLDRVPKSRRKAGGAKVMARQKRSYVTDKGIFRKVGSKKNQRSELLFWFKQSAVISPLFEFRKTAERIAKQKFEKHFRYWLERALKTAK